MESSNDEQRARMKKYIDAAIDILLTERQRSILLMYYDGTTVPNISKTWHISERAVYKNIKSSMKILGKQKNIFEKVN